ncbi:MAG: hypothetical protein OXI81_11895 [Paracoccaceae bacterium]|nr:hypothetical protein [Paracoccaceae bacterium]
MRVPTWKIRVIRQDYGPDADSEAHSRLGKFLFFRLTPKSLLAPRFDTLRSLTISPGRLHFGFGAGVPGHQP